MSNLAEDGFAIHERVLSPAQVDALLAELARHFPCGDNPRRAGTRNLLQLPAIRELTRTAGIANLLTPALGDAARPVRALLFDKTPAANWSVPWHQDVAIAVAEKREVHGFRGWSMKEGVPHVQPPAAILAEMLTVRLHLDSCGVANGPLRVLRGSHRRGRLDEIGIQRCKMECEEVIGTVPRGGALLMRPLLLHASSPATKPKHRRVLHLEFANAPLPGGLRWFSDYASSLACS